MNEGTMYYDVDNGLLGKMKQTRKRYLSACVLE